MLRTKNALARKIKKSKKYLYKESYYKVAFIQKYYTNAKCYICDKMGLISTKCPKKTKKSGNSQATTEHSASATESTLSTIKN